MNRSARRHRSTKIPNVKLRPPPPAEASSSRHGESSRHGGREAGEDAAAAHYKAMRNEYEHRQKRQLEKSRRGDRSDQHHDEDDENDEEEGDEEEQDDQRPLAGLVLCMSGITDEKGVLTDMARVMGAIVEANLTENATHLIAYSPGSDKYVSALRVGIPIMHPSWLHAVRKCWTRAQHIDFDELVAKHKLPPLQGIVLGLAGITDSTKRREIREDVREAAGETPIAFRLDGTFTHLVCENTASSETLQVVYKYRKKAERFLRRSEEIPDNDRVSKEMKAAMSLKLVRLEWLEDSLRVGGCLPEKHYLISEPRPTPEQRERQIEIILQHRQKREAALNEARRQAQHAQDPARGTKRTGEEAQQEVEDLEQPRKVKRPHMQIGRLVEQLNRGASVEPKSPVLLAPASIRDDRAESSEGAQEQQQRATPQLVSRKDDTHTHADVDNEEDVERVKTSERSYKEASFLIDLGDDERNKKAADNLRERGVEKILLPSDSGSADFHILPLSAPQLQKTEARGVAVTQFFVERCYVEGRLLRLDESFALRPSPFAFPLDDANRAHFAVSGLGAEGSADRCQATMALDAAGIKWDSSLLPRTHTHLLIGSDTEKNSNAQKKIARARKYRIPVVKLDYIDTMFRTGVVAAPASLPVQAAHSSIARLVARAGSSVPDSQDSSMELGETQYNVTKVAAMEASTDKENSKHTSEAVVAATSQRPWQRSASGSQAFLDGEASRGIDVKRQDDTRQHPSGKDYESLEAGTLAFDASTADEFMALLDERTQTEAGRVLKARNSNADGSFSAVPRRARRLPPSRRPGYRPASKSPDKEDARDGGRGPGPAGDIAAVEMLLAKAREEEAMRRLASAGATQMQQSSLSSQAEAEKEESIRVVYDDPVARRERRKMADLINMARSRREEQERLQALAVQTSSPASPTEQKHLQAETSKGQMDDARNANDTTAESEAQDSVRGTKRDGFARRDFEPTIKARKQPGTAIHM